MVDRCTGCRWRTPHKFGGEGILCFQKDGNCPDWIVRNSIEYRGLKSIMARNKNHQFTDEQLLETVRL